MAAISASPKCASEDGGTSASFWPIMKRRLRFRLSQGKGRNEAVFSCFRVCA